MSSPELRVLKCDWGGGVELIGRRRIAHEDGSSSFDYLSDIKFEHLPELAAAPRGPIIDNNAAQTLMDSLWDAGFRPTEGSGSAGALAATQNHLDDMRRISAHLLKLEKGLNE